MKPRPHTFERPIYVTRPLLPNPLDVMKRIEAIWASGWLTNAGFQHQELESALQKYLQAPFLSLFNNGTTALITACQALRLRGEVITTPFTFPATPHALRWNNITPIFADIDPNTLNLAPNRIEQCITSRTTAILGVHVFGNPCDVAAIQAIADRHGIKVIYDAAHAFGVTINHQPITAFGDATMLSFHATKLFHTAEGGALVVQDAQTKREIDLLKNFGINNEVEVLMPGINGKMSEIHAAIGLEVLKMVADERQKRLQIADIYRNRLSCIESIQLPAQQEHVCGSFQYFAIRIKATQADEKRDEIHDKLKQFNILTRRYFYPLCSNLDCYRSLPGAAPEFLPVANQVAMEILCLPFYGEMGHETAHRVCDALAFLLG